MNIRALRFVLPLVTLAGLTTLNGCAAEVDEESGEESEQSEDDLTNSSVGVTLDGSDNGATFAVQEGKKVIVNLSYGGFTQTPLGKWEVTSFDKSFGYPKITTKSNPEVPDAPTAQKLVWKLGPLVHAGESHRVTLTAKSLSGGRSKTFSFTAKIVNLRTGAKEGKMCGGIVGIMCADGLDCKMTSNHPDASGICRKRVVSSGSGQMCGGIMGLLCAEGFHCKFSGARHPDQSGTCVAD